MKIYINGNLPPTRILRRYLPGNFRSRSRGIPLPDAPSDFSVMWPWSGSLDDISLYNRALSQAEVQAIYHSDSTGKCLAPPVITRQPQGQNIRAGEDVLLSATILGTRPLKYQWRNNGLNIPGATNATLLRERILQIGIYSVAVTNAIGFASVPTLLSGCCPLRLAWSSPAAGSAGGPPMDPAWTFRIK